MPFENFYKESDKFARRWRIAVGVAFLLVISYLSIPFFAAWITSPETVEETPTGAERMRRVDALCSNLPKPEQFYFIGRDAPIDYGDATGVTYRYMSDRALEEIMPAFIVWFGENGWKPIAVGDSVFRKGNQTVTIRINSDYYYGNYEIYCYDGTISFGIYD
ncbi:MAG TPA: hypothetical protein VNB22_04660 [Pyrinomonadaceae bacterium]|nr:hypothetical protein [Pyrinomonadaceae bacterium]